MSVPSSPWHVLAWGEKFAPAVACLSFLKLERSGGNFNNNEDNWKEFCDLLEREGVPFTGIDRLIPALASILVIQSVACENQCSDLEDVSKETRDVLSGLGIPLTQIDEFIGGCGFGIEKAVLEFFEYG